MREVENVTEIDGIRVVQDGEEIEDALQHGESVYHWESGFSMAPLINDMEYCKVRPCVPHDVKRGDCVFCILRGEDGVAWPMVHQVWEISDASHTNELWFKIGSTGTSVFGWTKEVYGIAKGTDIYQELTQEMIDAMMAKHNAE